MEGIDFIKSDVNPTIRAKQEFYEIPLYKDRYFFMSLENYVNFIKGCEKIIRNSDQYKAYISELKGINLDHCQVLSAIHDTGDSDRMAVVEMHHGPIFTLFDYCGCLITHMLKHDKKINSFIVSKIILQEHFAGNIQTVMLSKTVHQLVDSNKLFISPKQAFGNLNGFLNKYKDGLLEDQVEKVNRYIELGGVYKSTDNGLLDLKETIRDWSRRRCY